MSTALKIATAVVGLLTGVVTGLYVLGGLVLALRLLFDHFSLAEIVSIIGQLPRELVVTTAMLDVLLPAASVGLAFGLLGALVAGERGIGLPAASTGIGVRGFVVLVVVTVALVALPITHALLADGPTLSVFASVIGIVTTFLAAYAGWYGLRSISAADGWGPGPKILLGAIAAATVALTPAVMFAASLSLAHAQACVVDSPAAVRGLLIGEGNDRVLLEQQGGDEAGVIALPSDRVSKSEYGDLSSSFLCPVPVGQQALPKVAEAALEGHGSVRERLLAARLRPRIFFDTHERWRPLEVESFVAEKFVGGGAHEACWEQGGRPCEPATGLEQLLPGPDAPDYLDIHGARENGIDYVSAKRGCHTSTPLAVDCNAGPRTAIYYRRTTHEGHWYWDYWWFYRFNDYTGPLSKCNSRLCSDHEGDWEGVSVITTPSLTPEVVGVIYAAHKSRILVEGPEAPLLDGHPLVFVAEGTHASYPFRCSGSCKQYATLAGAHLPEDSHNGAVAWGGNEDRDCAAYHCVRPLPEAGDVTDLSLPHAGAWAGWRGKWGRTCHEGCNSGLRELQGSPSSPGTQVRFQCPWAPTDRALPAPDASGLSRSERVGDAQRLLAQCAAQRGGF